MDTKNRKWVARGLLIAIGLIFGAQITIILTGPIFP